MIKRLMVLMLLAGVFCMVSAETAKAWENPKVRFLLQPWATVNQNGNPAGDGFGHQFFLRRARIIMAGKISDKISFFMETDNPGMGKNGQFANEMFIQDAFVDFALMDELKIAVGMILLPFSHHNRQSAASLTGLDYHNFYSNTFIANKVWRDTGVEFRGIVAKMIDYRIGVFRGLRGTCQAGNADCGALNPNDMPRFAGRVAFNVFDPEPGFFYGGNYMGKQKVLAFGVGFDYQMDSVLDSKGDYAPYMGFNGDVFLDYPLAGGKMSLVTNAAFVYFDRGYAMDDEVGLIEDMWTGMGAFGELGFRYEKWMPVLAAEWYAGHDSGVHDIMNFKLGLNYFIKGHNSNIKVEYGLLQHGKDADKLSNISLQTQFLF